MTDQTNGEGTGATGGTEADAVVLDDTTIRPGETKHLRYGVSETYLGDPVELPVTVLNGGQAGPRLLLTAALHGDELNGVKVCQRVATRVDPAALHGSIVIVHVCNVPGYLAQQRSVPIYDLDLNRAFPGSAGANTAERMADAIYTGLVDGADIAVDFHTSTRNRTTMYHVRGDTSDPAVRRLTRAFGANVILSGSGEPGSLRAVATADGVPTITVEMGRAHRFQPGLVDRALEGVDSVIAEYGLLPGRPVRWPGWSRVIDAEREKTWLRAETGGLVEMAYGEVPLVYEGDAVCRTSDHFSTREAVVRAPFTGLIVGVLQNPVAAPGHPLCHLVRVDGETLTEIEREIDAGEFTERPWA